MVTVLKILRACLIGAFAVISLSFASVAFESVAFASAGNGVAHSTGFHGGFHGGGFHHGGGGFRGIIGHRPGFPGRPYPGGWQGRHWGPVWGGAWFGGAYWGGAWYPYNPVGYGLYCNAQFSGGGLCALGFAQPINSPCTCYMYGYAYPGVTYMNW